MDIFSKLLGSHSPFDRLLEHLEIVMECVDRVEVLVDAALEGDEERLRDATREVFRLEHDADLVKNEIRDALPRHVMMPVARVDFLAFLRSQDRMADRVEDLAMMLSMRPGMLPKVIVGDDNTNGLREMASLAVQSASEVAKLTRMLGGVKEAGFRGEAVEKLRAGSERIGELEHEADKRQFKLLQRMLGEGAGDEFADSYVALRAISALGKLADQAETMSDMLRMMVAD